MSFKKNIKLKVCGMRDAENILEVMSLHPDYMGFIFYEGSPRYVGESFDVPPEMDSSVKRVGVFVNASPEQILQKAEILGLSVVQLHGNESIQTVRVLKKQGLTIFKVFSVSEGFDFEQTKPFQEHADYFLFDTKGRNYGGNAMTFDWNILENYDQQVPFILSGGLALENLQVIDRLEGMNLHGIDVNSGVEIRPALKDVNKIKEIQNLLNQLRA